MRWEGDNSFILGILKIQNIKQFKLCFSNTLTFPEFWLTSERRLVHVLSNLNYFPGVWWGEVKNSLQNAANNTCKQQYSRHTVLLIDVFTIIDVQLWFLSKTS